MSIKLPVVVEYNGKGAKAAKNDLASLAKSYAASAISAGALASVAVKAVKGALEEAQAQRVLALAVQNNTHANANQVAGLEQYISKVESSAAISDDVLRPALGRLVTVTGSLTDAQDLLTTSIDIAAYTGKDLETVTASVSKAYQGNIGALRRLGLAIDTADIKNKNFAAAWNDVKTQTEGANDAANAGAVGPWKKLGITIKNISDELGTTLISAAAEAKTAISGAVTTGKKDTQTLLDKLGTTGDALRFVGNAFKNAFNPDDPELDRVIEKLNKVKTLVDEIGSAAQFRAAETAMSSKWASIDAENKRKQAEAAKAAAERTRELAKANAQTLASALQAAKDKVQAITEQMAAYSASIRDTISGYASLSDAVSVAKSNEDDYQAALKDRADAYAELAKLQTVVFDAATGKTTVADAEDLAAALQKVADAETAVTTAKGKQRDYTKEFAAQVSAAKQFSTDLQSLIAAGLGAAGIQQLLNLGPVAGDAVAKDLLAGTKGITIGGLNADLASLATAGQTVGGQVAAGVYGADLLSAQAGVNAVTQAQSMNITIQATSADPDKIVAAIVEWSKKNGKLPSTIKVSA